MGASQQDNHADPLDGLPLLILVHRCPPRR